MCLKVYPCTSKLCSKKSNKDIFHYNYCHCHHHDHNEHSCSRFWKCLPVAHTKQSCSIVLHIYTYLNSSEHDNFYLLLLKLIVYMPPYAVIDYIHVFNATNNERRVIPAQSSQPGESNHFWVPVVEGGMKSL